MYFVHNLTVLNYLILCILLVLLISLNGSVRKRQTLSRSVCFHL